MPYGTLVDSNVLLDIMTEDPGNTRAWFYERGEHLDQGALTGTVATKQDKELALGD